MIGTPRTPPNWSVSVSAVCPGPSSPRRASARRARGARGAPSMKSRDAEAHVGAVGVRVRLDRAPRRRCPRTGSRRRRSGASCVTRPSLRPACTFTHVSVDEPRGHVAAVEAAVVVVLVVVAVAGDAELEPVGQPEWPVPPAASASSSSKPGVYSYCTTSQRLVAGEAVAAHEQAGRPRSTRAAR